MEPTHGFSPPLVAGFVEIRLSTFSMGAVGSCSLSVVTSAVNVLAPETPLSPVKVRAP
jgi:hypothetical protein